LLVDQGWRGAALDRLIELQLSAFGVNESSRLATSGPPVLLQPHATQLVGLALHELATNAAKYGALSNSTGAIEVKWEGQEDRSILLTWQERGGPKVRPPRREGFGHTVLNRTAKSLGTRASYDWAPGGLTWSIRIPVQHLLIEPVS
jgi:two-component sensor histidine kinase